MQTKVKTMNRLKAFLKIKEIYGLIFLAYLFSVGVRLIWVWMSNDVQSFFWNGQLMINTNDGYYWAEGARDILTGTSQALDGSPTNNIMSILTAFFAYILPFKFETVILFMPAFLSSLIVIPIILIGKSLGEIKLGFIAALISAIAWSYYNRTMVGYFDTDMLNIVFPALLFWSLILAYQTRDDRYLLVMAVDIIFYRMWYPQSYSLEFAFFILIFIYMIVKERDNLFTLKLLIMMLVAMSDLTIYFRIALVLAFYIILQQKLKIRYFYAILGVGFILFFASGGFDPIWHQLKGYVFSHQTTSSQSDALNLHFLSVMQTVSEAGKIPFERFANRISGNSLVFILSIIGYVLLIVRYKVMLLALPLIGLGFMAYGIPNPLDTDTFLIKGGGLRFTIYAIIPMAFGIAYLISIVVVKVTALLESKEENTVINFALYTVLTSVVLWLHISHIVDYKVPTVMTQQEVATLDKLNKIASREDYTVAWWDYAYPIRYYADVKTLADGGKHSGETNFPVSLALTMPQNISAKIARMTVEAYESNRTLYLRELLKKEHIQSTAALIDYLDLKEDMIPKKSRDIFYYLPFRMTSIFPVVESFRNIDIFSGDRIQGSVMQSFSFQNHSDRLQLTKDLYFSKLDGKLYQANRPSMTLRTLYQASYDRNGKINISKQLLSMGGKLNLLLLPNYGQVILLDDQALNSTYIQLFFFESYDKDYFEPVILSPQAKIFKVKI